MVNTRLTTPLHANRSERPRAGGERRRPIAMGGHSLGLLREWPEATSIILSVGDIQTHHILCRTPINAGGVLQLADKHGRNRGTRALIAGLFEGYVRVYEREPCKWRLFLCSILRL